MKFSQNNQPAHHGGRKPNAATIAKLQAMEQAEQARQATAFTEFEAAEMGVFDGFDMVDIFHRHFSKWDALEVLQSDDCADAVTSAGAKVHAYADGVTVYIMTEQARQGEIHKTVQFNRSVYLF